MNRVKIGVYPGTFDPLTFGHIDIISRASKLFHIFIIALPTNNSKNEPWFTLEERLSMIREEIPNIKLNILQNMNCCDKLTDYYIIAKEFSGLLVNFLSNYLHKSIEELNNELNLNLSNDYLELSKNKNIKQTQNCNSVVIVRGIRALSDFDYEFRMACVNNQLNPNIETIFVQASHGLQFISSTALKEIAFHNGDLSKFTTKSIISKLKKHISDNKR